VVFAGVREARRRVGAVVAGPGTEAACCATDRTDRKGAANQAQA
jgi:hypothetical protein